MGDSESYTAGKYYNMLNYVMPIYNHQTFNNPLSLVCYRRLHYSPWLFRHSILRHGYLAYQSDSIVGFCG